MCIFDSKGFYHKQVPNSVHPLQQACHMPTTPPGRWHCCLALRALRLDIYWILLIYLICIYNIYIYMIWYWYDMMPLFWDFVAWMLAAVLAVFILAHEDCRSSRSIPPQNSSPDMQTVLEGLFACEIQRRKPRAKSANVFLLVLLQTQEWSITCGSTLIEMNRLVYVIVIVWFF